MSESLYVPRKLHLLKNVVNIWVEPFFLFLSARNQSLEKVRIEPDVRVSNLNLTTLDD
jgi:hypothetical protein